MNALVPRNALFGFGALAPVPAAAPPLGWLWVERRFERVFEAIAVTDAAVQDGITKASRITRALNRTYWPLGPAEAKGILAGSWGKWTRVQPLFDRMDKARREHDPAPEPVFWLAQLKVKLGHMNHDHRVTEKR